jgi:type IV pilus assembly protein PilO
MNIDMKQLGADFSAQFEGLQGRHPGLWPLAPRLLCAAGVMAAVLGLGYFFYWSGQFEEQETLAAREQTLRNDYRAKMAQAINLDALEAQQQQVNRYVERLEKQLPSKAEMAALLSDINQAGLGRGLQFELFKPAASDIQKDFYAELPIQVKVIGTYHDMGAFAGDVGQLSRIVTLNDVNIVAGRDGNLSMDATARTFRYLNDDEVQNQRRAAAKKGPGKK